MRMSRLAVPASAALLMITVGGLCILLPSRFLDSVRPEFLRGPAVWVFLAASGLIIALALRQQRSSWHAPSARAKAASGDQTGSSGDNFQSEEPFTKIFRSSPVAICITLREDGQFIGANPAYLALAGYKLDELIGHTIVELGMTTVAERQVFMRRMERENSIRDLPDKFKTKDGRVLDVLTTCEFVHLDGQACILSMFHDISEQRKTSESLRESEISYRGLFDTVTDAIYIQDARGIFLDVNEGAAIMYGYSREELIGKSPLELAAPGRNDMEMVARKMELARDGKPQQFEFWGKRKNGQAFPKNVRVARGSYFGQEVVIAFAEDITERKAAEEALRAAESRYRALVENVPAVVYIDPVAETSTVYISPHIEELTGYTSDEWMADDGLWEKCLHPDDRDNVTREHARAEASLVPFSMEYRMFRRDGHLIWVHNHATLIYGEDGQPRYYQGVLIETTQERQAQEAILQSEERFSKIFQTSPIPTCITARENGQLMDANQAFWAFSGYEPGNALGNSVRNIQGNNPAKHRAFLEQMEQERSLRGVEDTFTRKSGEVLDVAIFHEAIRLNGQECILSMFHDITEQKLAQASIRREEAILNSIAFAADQFLKSPAWASEIDAILEKFGQAAEVSRVYIFQIASNQPSGAVVRQMFEWCSPDANPTIGDPSLQNFNMTEQGLERWTQLLRQGTPVYGIVRDLPPAEQSEFLREGILSIVCVPIMIEDEWWGFIGLDDCVRQRSWSESEIEALQTAANILSGAIQRELAGNAAQRQLKDLMMLHAVALACSQSADRDSLIAGITEIIDGALKPDNCGVLLVDEKRQALLPHPSYRGHVMRQLEQQSAIGIGLAGRVAATGRTLRVGDVQAEPEFVEIEPGIQSELCVPLLSNDQVIGVINVESSRVEAFDEADERLLHTIAGSLTTAMQKIDLFEVEGRRRRQAEGLREATTALTSSLDIQTLLNITLDLLADFAPYDCASIELIEDGLSRIIAGRSIPPESIGRTYQIDLKRRGAGNLREPIIIPDIKRAQGLEYLEELAGACSWMGVPLYAQDKLIGFINLGNKQEGFYSDHHAAVVQTLANQAAIALQNAQLFDAEQLRRKEAETLREAVAAVASELDQQQAIRRILEQLAKVVPYRTASVQILREGYLEIVGGAGWEQPSDVLGLHFPVPSDNPNTVVITERRAHILKDAPAEYDRFGEGAHRHIRSWLGVPLIVRDVVIGMLAIDHSDKDFYTLEHARLAETFANQAAIAIANARMFEEEKRRSQIIEALADIANELATTQEMGHLLDKVSQKALHLLRASHVAIYLVQNDNKTVKVVSAQGTYSKELISHSIEVGKGITGNIIAEGKSEIINDTRVDPRTIRVPGTPAEDGEVETMMSSALIIRGKAIGALNAWRLRSDGLFNESELNFLISIAHQTSISIELSRLFHETRRRAQQAAAIAEVGRDVSATLELDLVLERIAQYAKDLLNAETSAVYLYDQGDSRLHGVAVMGADAEELKADPLVLGSGIVGGIALSKNGEIVNYVAADPRAVTVKGTDTNPAEHIMAVPVLTKEELTGLLVVWRSGQGLEFEPPELDFLSSLAQQAAVAIQNARSFAAEQNQRLREASMLDLMRLAASSLDLDEVNLTILGHLLKLIPSDSGTIQLLRGDRLQVSAALGFPAGTIQQGSNLMLEDFPLNNEVITQKKPVRIGHTDQDERYRLIAGIKNNPSILAIPIIFRENVIGMATLDSVMPERFTEADEKLALAVANNAANAIGNARLFELEQQGRQEAENLRVAASAVTSSLDPKQVLETILTALKQVVPYDSAAILLIEGEQVRITAGQGLPDLESAVGRTFPADNRLLTAIAENSSQPIILYDAQIDPRFERWAASDSVRGWMGVPLATRGETVGFITLDSYKVGAFDANSAALAQTFAYQAAAAIDNARLYQETRSRLEDLEVISRVSFALRSTHEPNDMLPLLLREVLKVMETDAASIWLYDSATNQLEQKIASGWQDDASMKQMEPNESIAGAVFRSGEVHIIDDFPSDPVAHGLLAATLGKGWGGVGVPIRTSTQIIGAMIVAIPLPRRVQPAQIQLLTTLAEIAGNAIHRAQLYDQSEEQVRRLTALRDVDTAISSSFDLRVTLNILLDHTLSQLRADAAAILAYSPEMRSLSHIASLGFHRSSNIQGNLRISGRLLNETLLERKDMSVENIAEEPGFHRKDVAEQEKFTSYYATPLVSKGQVKGILEVYYRKPHPPVSNWLEFFQTMAGQAAIAIDNSQLFDNLQRSNQELSLAYDTTLEGWGKALELRDKETQGHTVRVSELTLRLARRLAVPEADLIHIRRGVLLHDIGKMAVPDHILKKSGPLDDNEWIEMRKHPQYAYDLLYPITYLRPALDIPYSHHERWDGKGYPRKIKGDEIPIAARIFAVVDVWDALLFDRPYRKAWPREEVIDYVRAEIGTRFDPRVALEFLKMIEEDDEKAE